MRIYDVIQQVLGTRRKRIYLDYMATTPVRDEVLTAMGPFWNKHFANPWSQHADGAYTDRVVSDAREMCASILHAHPNEIIFTASATEGNTQAIKGLIEYIQDTGDINAPHILFSSIEHASVRTSRTWLEAQGCVVEYIPVTEEGVVNPQVLAKLLRPETVLVSIMMVNSEIGTLQPIREIARVIRRYKKQLKRDTRGVDTYPLLHTDASQAPLTCDMHVEKLGVDMATFDGHKIYGPKGVGMLFVRNGTHLTPLLFNTHSQMQDIRAGTPAVPLIQGFTEAFVYANRDREKFIALTSSLQEHFKQTCRDLIPEASFNGSMSMRVPHNMHVSIPGANHEFLQVALDEAGVSVSRGSACSATTREGSHVIEALHIHDGDVERREGLRFSFGWDTTKQDITYALQALKDALSLTM